MRPAGGEEIIQVLSGLTAVRRRPGMFAGDCATTQGLEEIVDHVLCAALKESWAGPVRRLEIQLRSDGAIAVSDDGHGWPMDLVQGLPRTEQQLRTMFGMVAPLLAIANALSARLEIDIRRDGMRHQQAYVRGEPLAPFRAEPFSGDAGTTLVFWPDPLIFRHPAPSVARLATRLSELSLYAPRTRFVLVTPSRRWEFQAPKFAVHHSARQGDEVIDIALGWLDDSPPRVLGFSDDRACPDGGSHIDALRRALFSRNRSLPVGQRRHLEELGATVVIHNCNGRFDSARRRRLYAPDLVPLLRQAAREALAALPDLPPRQEPLEAHLTRHPTDERTALVLADKLTAAGDPRGELIALEHALWRGAPIAATAERIADLLAVERPRIFGLPGGFPFQRAYRGRLSLTKTGAPIALGRDTLFSRVREFLTRQATCVGIDPPHPDGEHHAAASHLTQAQQPLLDDAINALGATQMTLGYHFDWTTAALGELAALQDPVFYETGLASLLGVNLADSTATVLARLPRLRIDDDTPALLEKLTRAV
jgi:hypothetical protein